MTAARVAFVLISELHLSSSFFCAAAPVLLIIDASNLEMVSWILSACLSADVLMSLKVFFLSFRLASKSFSVCHTLYAAKYVMSHTTKPLIHEPIMLAMLLGSGILHADMFTECLL